MNKIVFFLGLAASIAGIVVGLVTEKWSVSAWGLFITGLIFLIIWFVLINRNKQDFWNRRSTQAGTNAAVSTLALLIIIGLINFLGVRYSLRLDLTENQLFTLSPQSQTIIQNLSQPLKVWIFDRNVDPDIQTLLENYQRYGDNFQYEFVDPDIQVQLRERFSVQSNGEIYLEYGGKKQLVQSVDKTIGNRLSEVQLTNAIERIKRDRTPLVYFLQGHGEPQLEGDKNSLSVAVKSLSDKGYTVKPLNLATSGKIPDRPDVIIIPGPIRKLFPQEVTTLQNYLKDGGSLLLMLIPKTDPQLTPLLKDWGIELDDRFIIDASGAGSILGFGPAAPLITTYGNHPITEQFGNGISIFPESRPIAIKKVEGVEATPLVITDPKTWAERNIAATEIAFNQKEDIQGPLNVGFALTRNQSSGKDTTQKPSTQSRLAIFGSSTFITNGWFEQQLNGDIFLNTINWLVGEDEQTICQGRNKHP